MGFILFLLFLATPLLEVFVFIKVGGVIGLWPTIGIVVLTALLGATLWRAQGLAVWARAQAALGRGELPVAEVTDGAFLLVAGALLLTPGFITDAIGFLLFLPPVRHWLGRHIFRHLRKRMQAHVDNEHSGRGPVIDGEVTERDD